MAIRVLFDNTEISADYIVGLFQKVQPYTNSFKLGATICRSFDLRVDNRAFSSVPSKVYLYEGNTIYATLYVDSYNSEDDNYTIFSLVDAMVLLNKTFTYQSASVSSLVSQICSNHSISFVGTISYLGNMTVSWSSGLITERQFVSYVAEVNGGYAYINASGNLVIASLSNTPVETINISDCSNFKLGANHLYDRVYVELGSATHYYPSTSTNDTLYLNPDNILLTDSGSYTIDGIVQHIYSVINGYQFYNVSVSNYPIGSALAGQKIRFTDGTNYDTICFIDYDYFGQWNGGNECDLNSSQQDETTISEAKALSNKISIIVDRELGSITQDVEKLTQDMYGNATDSVASRLQQTANNILLQVSESHYATETQLDATNGVVANNTSVINQLSTSFQVKSDGVYVSQNDVAGNYVRFTSSGMEIYVGGNKIAWAESNGFKSTNLLVGNWQIQQSGNVLNIFYM